MVSGTGASPTPEQLQDLLLESPGFTDFLLGLTTMSATRLGGPEPMLCAITVERDGSPATVPAAARTRNGWTRSNMRSTTAPA